MATTQTTEASIQTLVCPAGGEFEVLVQVGTQYVHIAWAGSREQAERIAAQVYAK